MQAHEESAAVNQGESRSKTVVRGDKNDDSGAAAINDFVEQAQQSPTIPSPGSWFAESASNDLIPREEMTVGKQDTSMDPRLRDIDIRGSDGSNVLSEDQTSAALAALQEAMGIRADLQVGAVGTIYQPGETDAAGSPGAGFEETVNASGSRAGGGALAGKRKAEDSHNDGESAQNGSIKRRPAPVRLSWEDRLQMLCEYKEEHGDLWIPIRYKKNPSLGKFVHNMREQYKLFHKMTPDHYRKTCSMTSEKIAQLDELGFVWTTQRTKRQDEDWNARFEQLKQYKEKAGNCDVPHGFVEDPSFAEWIHRQRTTYATMCKEENPNPKTKERMERLADIGFKFFVHSDKWTHYLEELKAYKEKHGDCQVPTHYNPNQKLGRWVHTQRHQRRLQQKGKKTCMTDVRIRELDDLGFSWEVRPSTERPRATWLSRREELRKFREEYGNFLVPDTGDWAPLHTWCQEQHVRLKSLDTTGKDVSRRMGPDRVESLRSIGFTKDTELWSPSKTTKEPATSPQGDAADHSAAAHV